MPKGLPGRTSRKDYKPASRKPHACPACHRIYSRAEYCRRHWALKHAPPAYPCLHCPHSPPTYLALLEHHLCTHPDREIPADPSEPVPLLPPQLATERPAPSLADILNQPTRSSHDIAVDGVKDFDWTAFLPSPANFPPSPAPSSSSSFFSSGSSTASSEVVTSPSLANPPSAAATFPLSNLPPSLQTLPLAFSPFFPSLPPSLSSMFPELSRSVPTTAVPSGKGYWVFFQLRGKEGEEQPAIVRIA